jgi:peptidoglycan/xylan/chitin deacetylase (PgdA/CDA1 family)
MSKLGASLLVSAILSQACVGRLEKADTAAVMLGPTVAPVSSVEEALPFSAGGDRSTPALDEAPVPPAAPPRFSPIASCKDARKDRGFYGFYRTDAWEDHKVALTFDDGPHPTATPQVLDLLALERLHATFFVVGRNINRDTYPLVQRMVREGHALGSHSYTHNVHMTQVGAPEATVEEISGQHVVTAILVDLALMAGSKEGFDADFDRVFERDPDVWLTGTTIRKEWRGFARRHVDLLRDRGFVDGERPYDLVFSRPPGGGPYVEHDGAAGIALYDRALAQIGMVNVMWHGASGDTVPVKRSDFHFLTKNMEDATDAGGVVLIHDYMRKDALQHSLRAIRAGEVEVVGLDQATVSKYGCGPSALYDFLRGSGPEIAALFGEGREVVLF